MKKWTAKATGDMTLSVISDPKEIILSVDMLENKTMEADKGGNVLVRAMNNLELLANILCLVEDNSRVINLLHPDGGVSPFPWSIISDRDKYTVVIKDCNNKNIAKRKYPKGMNNTKKNDIINTLETGVNILNTIYKI